MKSKISLRKLVSFLLIFSLIFPITISPITDASATEGYSDDVNENQGTLNEIKVVDDGVYIGDSFYSKEEFEILLDQAVFIENENPSGISTFAITSAIAGTWWIPGVGEIVITAAGVILIGGAVIKAGTWIYNTIEAYFAERAYNEHKKNGTKTEDHSVSGSGLPITGNPLSSKDRTADGSWNGKVVQRRYYDKNGNADMDIDYTDHGNPKQHPKVPHRHDWNGNSRGPGY